MEIMTWLRCGNHKARKTRPRHPPPSLSTLLTKTNFTGRPLFSTSTFHDLWSTRVDLRLVAVSSRHHPLAGDEGPAAEVIAGVQRHLIGNGAPGTLVTPDDLFILSNWNHVRELWRDEQAWELRYNWFKNDSPANTCIIINLVKVKVDKKQNVTNLIWSYTLLQVKPGISGPSWWLISDCNGKFKYLYRLVWPFLFTCFARSWSKKKKN